MKIIRISDTLHTKLKEHADIDRRTINGEAEIILELYFSDAEGGLSSEQVAKDRMREAQEVREFIVNEGKELGILPETTPLPKKIESPKPAGNNVVNPEIFQKSSFTGATSTDLELACCNNSTPCRHWQWDASTGEGYKNILSGRFREAN